MQVMKMLLRKVGQHITFDCNAPHLYNVVVLVEAEKKEMKKFISLFLYLLLCRWVFEYVQSLQLK